MTFVISPHAAATCAERGIAPETVRGVLANPEQVVPGHGGRSVYQSRFIQPDGSAWLLRVIVMDASDPAVVVTAYRTTRVSKYWRNDESHF